MAYSQNLEAAAHRHFNAAETLFRGQCTTRQQESVAGYLYGIAAEWALKQQMLLSGIRPLSERSRCKQEDPFYVHFPQLKTLLRDRTEGRREAQLRRYAMDQKLMQDWDVRMRYAPEILMFGTAQTQTIEDYRYLLAHLREVAQAGGNLDWRERIRRVHAKAPANSQELALFREDLLGLFLEYLYEESSDLNAFNFAPDDPDAPHFAVPIAMDTRFANWDPVRRPSDLESPFYESTFSPFFTAVESLLAASPTDPHEGT